MAAHPSGARTETVSGGEILPLLSLLKEQSDTVRELIDAAREMQRAISEQDHALLERVAAREGTLASQLKELEERRLAWVSAWAAAHSIDSDITVSELIRRIPAHRQRIAHSLRVQADDLARLLADLRELHEVNAGLLYHSLAFTRMILGALTEGDVRGKTYGPGAAGNPGANTRSSRTIVDRRA